MPKLPILSSKDVIRALKHLGFKPVPKRGKGSHFAFVRKTTVPGTLLLIGKHILRRYLVPFDL